MTITDEQIAEVADRGREDWQLHVCAGGTGVYLGRPEGIDRIRAITIRNNPKRLPVERVSLNPAGPVAFRDAFFRLIEEGEIQAAAMLLRVRDEAGRSDGGIPFLPRSGEVSGEKEYHPEDVDLTRVEAPAGGVKDYFARCGEDGVAGITPFPQLQWRRHRCLPAQRGETGSRVLVSLVHAGSGILLARRGTLEDAMETLFAALTDPCPGVRREFRGLDPNGVARGRAAWIDMYAGV